MSPLNKLLLKNIFFTIISLTLLLSCTSEFASSVRKVTYPHDFKYIERSELRVDMHKLTLQMEILDYALIKPTVQTQDEIEAQRHQVLVALTNMGIIAAQLKAGNSGANHPFMDDYMQNLVGKIDEARTAASLAQPRYYFAGKVSGACVNCHKINR